MMTVIRQWYYLSKLRYIFIVCLSFGRITGRILSQILLNLAEKRGNRYNLVPIWIGLNSQRPLRGCVPQNYPTKVG